MRRVLLPLLAVALTSAPAAASPRFHDPAADASVPPWLRGESSCFSMSPCLRGRSPSASPCLGGGLEQDDDYTLAGALLDRGWTDLARELYKRIESGASSAEQRAEGTYGLLRVEIREARSEPDPKKKAERFDRAIAALQKFIDDYRSHPRRAEALSDLGELRQEKGRWLISQAKSDPAAVEKAEKEFEAAEKLFQDQVDELNKNAVKPPDDEKDKRQKTLYDEWDQKMMFAKYNKGIAMFSHAEAYRENPDAHAKNCPGAGSPSHPRSHCAMRKKLAEMIDFFNNDFMWQYEQYLLAYDAFIYLGRACQLLAEYADRAEAEKFWIQCFASIGKAKGLLTDPESRRNEAVRDLAVRAYYWEVKARLSYGDTKSGVAAVREYQKAYRLAEDLFKIYPQSRKEDMGKAILLEQAKAYCKAGEVKKGIELLQRIKLENPGTQIEDFAVDILGEFAGEDDLKLAIESADNIFSRGVTWLYKALQKYRRALSAIKTEAERKAWFPYCWLKIAECYFHLGRYHEAAAACSVIVYDRSPWLASEHAQKAALTKLDALNRLAKQTKDSADQRALNEYNTWAASQPAIRDLLGDGPTYNAAIDLETRARTAYEAKNTPEAVKNYLEAVRLWEQVAGKPGSTYRTIAIFSIGFDYYNAGDIVIREVRRTKNMPDVQKAQRTKEAIGYWDKALARFAEYLAAVERTAKDDKVTRYSIGAIFYSCIIHSDPEKNQPGKALDISEGLEKKYPNADPKLVMSILARRIEAKLRMDDNGLGWCPECKVAVKPESGACPKCKKAVRSYLDEAEEDMQALKNRYEKEGSGRDNYLRALIIVAQKLEQKAYDLRTENPAFAKELMIRAANYWYVFYTTNTEPFKGDQLEAIAEKLFFAAEERLERAGKETDDDARAKTLAQAKDLFGKARVLFETFLAEFGSTLPPERSKAVKRMITRAAVKSGEFKKAIDSLLEIIGKETVDSTTQGSVWEDLADCYFAQAKEMPLGDDKLKLFQKADNIYATLASSLMQGNRIGEDFYRLAAKHAASLWFYDPDKLDKFFTAMDGRGYGRRFACEKCRQVMSGAQLKGASACLFDRCTVCGTAVKRGTAPTCPACKGAVQPCDGAGFLQVAWDDQLRHECAASFVCRHWRCGNAPREYRLRCPKSGCGFETASERPVADCPKCKTKLDLTGFRKFLCGKCDCPLEMENAGGPAQDCPTHYKCGKCRRGSLKPGACPCGGALAECACGGKQTLAPLCVACESRADIRRAKCAKCGDLFLPRWLKDKTKCPKDGGDLTETWEPLALAGCGKRFAPQFVDDLKRMKCSACEKSYPPDRNLERTGSCPDEKCPAAGKGRLIDLVECDKCRKFGTVMQIRAWSAEDCQPGAFCDEFESWRALVVKRVPNKDRPPEPSSRHVHPQTLKEESQLTGGKK